jgi:hypothetical protein
MRLHRHDEIVEAMARAIYRCGGVSGPGSANKKATAALDAMLEAASRLGTIYGQELHPNGETRLILKLEPKP